MEEIALQTPKGILLHLLVEDISRGEGWVSCAIRKDGGDDPDVTNGILVYAKVSKMISDEYQMKKQNISLKDMEIDGTKENPHISRQATGESETDDLNYRDVHDGLVYTEHDRYNGGDAIFGNTENIEIELDGGIGVGRVTRTGLYQQPGEAAINPVPRKMILESVEEICQKNGFSGKLHVEISIPAGVELAKRTFNPRLGIEGGISVLGTSGIVVPMSEDALIASIRLEMKMHVKNGAQYLVITPGNYGAMFSREE